MGAGSIGCYVGGRLVACGAAKVTFVGRNAMADAVAEHGVTLRAFGREDHIDSSQIDFATDPQALSSCDVVLCCVKSGGTAEAATALAQMLPPRAVVVSMQNGVRNTGILRRHLPNNQIVPAVVGFNVVAQQNVVFHLTATGPLVVETKNSSSDRAWVNALRTAGIEIEEVDDIAPERWTKLLVNLNNAVSALCAAPTREMILSRRYRRVMTMLLDEGLLVLEKAGIRPAAFRGVPLRLMSLVLKLPTPIVRLVVRAQLRVDPKSRASMWQDLERGTTTEVDFLNGEIIRLAKAHSMAAPINERIVQLVHQAEEAGRGSPRMDAEELIRALRG